MSKIIKKAASPEIFNAAWKKLRNDNALWDIGISKKEMQQDFVYHILKLSKELQNGKYRPGPVKFFPVTR